MKIVIRPHAKGAAAKPDTFLGGSLFSSYLGACKAAGARYDPASRQQVIGLELIPDLIASLAAESFDVEVDPAFESAIGGAQQKIEQAQASATVDREDAERRLAEVEARLVGGLKPFPFQRDGVRWLAERRAGLLADEMGLGKTVQALLAIPENAPTIVVGPAAVKGVWKMEAKRWRPEFRVHVLNGRNSFIWPAAGAMHVLNYDVLPEISDDKPAKVIAPNEVAPGTVLIADEAHALKNRTARRTKRFLALSKTVRKAGGRVYLLTGTPLLNRPPELWQVLAAAGLETECFGSWPRFMDLFSAYKTRWATEWGMPKPEVPGLLRRVSLQRRRAQVLPDLPTKTYRSVPVNDLNAETRAACDAVVDSLKALGIELADALSMLVKKDDRGEDFEPQDNEWGEEIRMKVKKVLFEDMARCRKMLAVAKVPALVGMIEEFEDAGEPIVVFSMHRAPIDVLGEREGWATITGDVAPERRSEIVAKFQAGELKGVALTVGAGGTGLTLTRAHQIIFVDLAWTPALNQQAEDRVCRIGQDRGVIVTRLVAEHPLDERVAELLGQKQALIEASVESSSVTKPGEIETPKVSANVTVAGRSEPPAPTTATPEPVKRSVQHQGWTKRGAANEMERWAAEGLVLVAALDPDRARTVNNVGFSKFDNEFGHSLATQIQMRGELSDKQWSMAVKMANKYRRQIGPAPEGA